LYVATHNYTLLKKFHARTLKCENGKLLAVKDEEENSAVIRKRYLLSTITGRFVSH